MSYYFLNNQARELQSQLSALKASTQLLNTKEVAKISTGVRDILNQNNAAPRNFREAVQLFYREFFGQADPYYYTSKYGTPVYNYLLISGAEASDKQNFSKVSTLSSYRTKYTNNGNNPNTWDELSLGGTRTEQASFPAVFMDSAIIKVSKKKKIIKTNIVNNPYSRKEYISSGDYDIQISGVFTTDNAAVYPESDVNALIRACEAPIPLTILSPYLYRFGITRMVVEGFDFPNERGSYASQKFSIRACSHVSVHDEVVGEVSTDTQNKNFIKKTIDEIGNLRSTIDEAIGNVDLGGLLSSDPKPIL